MTVTLDEFAAECRRLLQQEPGKTGREKVCALVANVLRDQEFVARYVPPDAPERHVLYEDTELGFTILAHGYRGAKESGPHDHGPSWAIYGQAVGETIMTDWECLQRPTSTSPGKARWLRTYTLRPGTAHLYEPGVLHSPRRDGATRLLRIEGVNMDRVQRLPYVAVASSDSPATVAE